MIAETHAIVLAYGGWIKHVSIAEDRHRVLGDGGSIGKFVEGLLNLHPHVG